MAFGEQCIQQSPIVQIALQVSSELLSSKWKRNFRQQSIIAPGTRIELRNEEWLNRRADATFLGGQQLTCIGLVKDKEGVFLTELGQNKELGIKLSVFKPEDAEFIQDNSDGFIFHS